MEIQFIPASRSLLGLRGSEDATLMTLCPLPPVLIGDMGVAVLWRVILELAGAVPKTKINTKININ